LDFKTLGLSDIELLRPYFSHNLCRICDCTIGGTFIWRDLFKTEYAIVGDILYLKVRYLTGDIAFTPPREGVMTPHGEPCADKEAYDRIIDYCRQSGLTPRLCAVSEHRRARILELYPNARAATDRAWTDYLYLSDDIKDLPGRKFSGQRNHINKFLREYPDWAFEKIDGSNLKDVREFFETYAREHVKDYPAYDEGNIKTLEVLDDMSLYRQSGGVLKVEGRVVGAALGETIGDTLFVHIEKSLTEYQGSYPMLVNQFAKMYAVDGVTRINREEDDGVEGLRTSKLSYHPVDLLNKYVVELI
jgi:hypothetical protein